MAALATALALALGAAGPMPATTLVVLNKSDATASLVDLASGRVAATLPTGAGPHEVAVSLDGATALVTNYGTRDVPGGSLTVIDLPAARVARTIAVGAGRRPHGVVFLHGRRALVTAEGARAVLVVDVEAGAVEATIETGQEISHMVAVAPDRARAFVGNIGSGTVTAIDLRTRAVLAQIATGRGAEGIAVTPDGKEVWVVNRDEDTVSAIDATTLTVAATIASPSFPIRVAFTPDGRRALVTHARSGDVALVDVAARREMGRMRADATASVTEGRLLDFAGAVPIGIVVDPAGARAYVAHANADAVAVFDLASRKVVTTLRAGREPDGVALSPVAVTRR